MHHRFTLRLLAVAALAGTVVGCSFDLSLSE
jgi:hypothetical protein